MRFKTRSAGFSLIEMAIGLLIVGLISGPMLMEYAAWKNSQLRELTVGNEYKTQAALTKYAQNNGCYPLPSPPGVTSAAATFGVEVVRPVTDPPCRDITAGEMAAIPACTGNDTVVCKTPCIAGSANCPAGATNILIGDVPFSTLGLPKQYILDGFRRKITYAVSANLLQSSTFNNSAGVVRVQDLTNTGPPNATGTPITIAHYALVSHGRDGVGGFTLDGGTMQAACAGAGVDLDNCNNNGNFNNGFGVWTKDVSGSSSTQYDRLETAAVGATHFDDFVMYSTTISSDIWAKNNASDIVSNTGTAGNVLIKLATVTGAANPQARLDVRGDVSADGVWTNAICDTSANSYAAPTYTNRPCVTSHAIPANVNGFDPAILATTPPKAGPVSGSGIHCGAGAAAGYVAGAGLPMTAIASADEECASLSGGSAINVEDSGGTLLSIASCGAGQAPYGVLAGGTLKCWTVGTPHPYP